VTTTADTFTPKQTYKNCAEAYRLFFLAQGIGVGQTKFYNDAARLHLVNQDKTLNLSSLLAYVKEELKIEATTGRSIVERDQSQRKDDLEIRERELKIAKLEREGRKDDREWIRRDTVNEREGALVGTIMSEAKYRLSRAVPELIVLCKGDVQRAADVADHLDKALYLAFKSIYDSAEIDIAFAEVDAEDEL
jgi:hypothetical protein